MWLETLALAKTALSAWRQSSTPTPPPAPSKFAHLLGHMKEHIVMKIVCCAPDSVVLEIDIDEDDDLQPSQSDAAKDVEEDAPRQHPPRIRQRSAVVAPVPASLDRELDDIPTTEELNMLPIDLSFVFEDAGERCFSAGTRIMLSPCPSPSTPARLRKMHSARLIQRRWRQFMDQEPATEVDEDETTQRKTRRRRIRKHRSRKKKQFQVISL